MITPVPAGVNPNTHRCGCGGMLRMPWVHDLKDHALVCTADHDHNTYQKKHTGTRMLYDGETGELKEYNELTQKPTTELAPITDQATALATVNRAVDLGLFPGKQNAQQLELLAQVALAYQLDPLMGEIMPFQGRPYITIAGRRRLDNVAGHRVSVAFRPPTSDEETYWTKVEAMAAQDVIQICVGTDMDSGMTVEGFGRVLAKERTGEGLTAAAKENLPTIQRALEMAQKRGERRMREIMFGPVGKPDALINVQILEEGDESNVVEGTARIVADNGLPALGNCPAHDIPWRVEERYGKIRASHPLDGEWCNLDKLYGLRFQEAYVARFGTTAKAQVDTWLKDHFAGATWSKMDAPMHIEAVRLLTDAPGGTESTAQPPEDTEPSDIPTDTTEAQESSDRPSNAELDLDVEREQAAMEH